MMSAPAKGGDLIDAFERISCETRYLFRYHNEQILVEVDGTLVMRIHTLNRKQVIAKPLDRIFPFFTKAENLALITPPSLAFRVLTPSPVPMERGRIIDYTIRILGLEVRWRSMITTYEPPVRFVDEQIKGPYSFWHHTHTFECRGDSTVMHDLVRYALPLLPLPGFSSDLAHNLYVRPNLEHIFNYRRDVITRLFGSNDGEASADEAELDARGGEMLV